jgi:hypothetical protein
MNASREAISRPTDTPHVRVTFTRNALPPLPKLDLTGLEPPARTPKQS